MKRLEHIRTLRNQTSRFQAKTPNGAVMVLAQIAQEKQRLEQERGNWQARVHKIDARLKQIDQMEKQLLTVASFNHAPAQERESAHGSDGLPPGVTEVTVRY
jgi:hypothetical protein